MDEDNPMTLATPRHLAFCAFRAGSLKSLICLMDSRSPTSYSFRATFASFPRACRFGAIQAAKLGHTTRVSSDGPGSITVTLPVYLARHTRLPTIHARIKIRGLNIRALHATLQRAGYHRRAG